MIINYDGQDIEMNDEFSFKDFTGNYDIKILNGVNIYASCFSQETPDSNIFPKDMIGVVFYNCNLDNCFIPDGNKIIGRQPQIFQVQPDGFDWILDKNNNPVKKIGI